VPHLWEEYGEGMFEHLLGQFAFALWDARQDRLILARDRMGICPLFYTVRRGPGGEDLLLFASEVKALLASGMVPARPDIGGLNHVFSFFAVPGPLTCFEGVQCLLPGRYLRLALDGSQPLPLGTGRPYWQIEYPDWGSERDPAGNPGRVVDEFERLLLAAVDRRLRADVPVVSYLSGGVDSSMVVALASKVLGRPIPTFTISVQAEGLNEESEAAQVARFVGSEPVVVRCGHDQIRDTYPELIEAAEAPVIDTSCAALLMLARSVRGHGFKVALTGEGADEWLAGYPWFKVHRLLGALDFVPGLNLSMAVRRLGLWLTRQPRFPASQIRRAQEAVGGHNGWLDIYGLMGLSKLRFFHPDVKAKLEGRVPYEELELNPDLRRWHPFHRSLYLGTRVMLSGHLLSSKGDRVAMHSSVETRYPFLDERVLAFVAGLHPRWKLRRLFHDKYLLRQLAKRWLPKEIAARRKAMFRAPLDSFHLTPADGGSPAPWIEQVLSPESLRKTGYFDAEAVRHWRAALPRMRRSLQRISVEMGLVAVTAAQLWHHLYISGDLAEIPSVVGRLQRAEVAA
ncbi:MAG TPA: asparagine synthase (glutamine-hydrolyzing), partial [Gemmataceae bacterium]